nr:rhomboid family intramembrane serine protease [uncultured Pseudodesulfovibrio sp.]
MHSSSNDSGFLGRAFRPVWVDLAPFVRDEPSAKLSHEEAKLWALILASRHVPHRLRQLSAAQGGGYTVQVQEWFADRAKGEISLYFEENTPDWRTVTLVDLRPVSGLEPTMYALALLVLFYWVYNRTFPGMGLYPALWVKLGSADAGAILSGEWWRLATALTLHGSGPHVAGNAVIGGVFIWLASRRLGAGLTWLLTFGAGILGNLINSIVLGVHHDAIGFSTATFGAAGVLAAISSFHMSGRRYHPDAGYVQRTFDFIRSAVIPFGAGLGLLAMLGAGEETDLGAHLFGFLSGLGLGFCTGFATNRLGLPNNVAGGWLYVAALAIPVFAWIWAWVT